MNEKTNNNSDFDPIEIAEIKLGKRHEYWNDKDRVAALTMIAMQAKKCNSEPIESIGDTHFGMSWHEFIEIVKGYGFKCGFCQKFTGTAFSKIVEEEEVIFFHEEKGLILYAESFSGETVNGASVYGEIILNGAQIEPAQSEKFGWYIAGNNGNGTKYFAIEARNWLLFHLDAISNAFEFSKSWSKVQPSLWFLNYMDIKKENYNYEKINEGKIASSTPEVRKIIFG